MNQSALLLLGVFAIAPVWAQGTPAEENLPYKYAGHVLTRKFHRPSCAFAKAMQPGHIRLFHFRCQAIADGFKPCRWCLPPVTRSVTARLRVSSAKTGDDDGK